MPVAEGNNSLGKVFIMTNRLVLIGGVNALLAILLGGFATHALKAHVTPDMLEVFKTGVTYHTTHALAMILVGLISERHPQPEYHRAAALFQAGIVLFSGSLYAMAISGLKTLGMITPIGGMCYIIGWILFIVAAKKST